MSTSKKIVVVGGTGLIGSKVVEILRGEGHDAIVATPSHGTNALTGEGVAAAVADADAVIDVSNLMSFDADVVKNFFSTSTKNLTVAEKAAGVRHHVALSIVGADGLASNPYMAGKLAQEEEVKASGQPYTIVRATQFFEFIATLADAYAVNGEVVVPEILFQPIAAAEVAAALARVALEPARNGTIDIAGPDRASFAEIVRKYLKGINDKRVVRSDAAVGYFGSPVVETSLVPKGDAQISTTSLSDWLNANKTSENNRREAV